MDYRYKRFEYAAQGVTEYWIVDPHQRQVMVLTLVDGWYEEALFRGSDRVISHLFPTFALTVQEILQA